ncbi:MAG: hypothetical protein ACLSGB_03795 [Dorea sp.]
MLAENQLLETTKDKKDQHWHGTFDCRRTSEKLGGMVEYYEDEMFCAHVYLLGVKYDNRCVNYP